MLAIESADVVGVVFAEIGLLRYTNAGRGPHVCHVDILIASVIEVTPAGAHAGAGFVDSCLRGTRSECAVALVLVQIAATEVVGNVEIGQPV